MRSRLAPLALASVLLLGGCATVEAAPSSPSATPSALPSPSATPSAAPSPTPTETPVLAPDVAYGGDCASVLSSAQLDDLLGAGWKVPDYDVDNRDRAKLSSLATLGGIECRWWPADTSDRKPFRDLWVVALPAEEVPAGFAADYAEVRCDQMYDATNCRVAETVGDLWIGVRGVQLWDEDPPVAFLERALEEVTSVITSPPAHAVDRSALWWTLPDCADLGDEMGIAEFIGKDYGSGYWEGSEQPEGRLLREVGVEAFCPWFTGDTLPDDGEFYFLDLTVSAGAGWQWDDIAGAADAQPLELANAQHAVAVDRNGDSSNDVIYASDGVNVIEISGVVGDMLVELADRAMAALAP